MKHVRCELMYAAMFVFTAGSHSSRSSLWSNWSREQIGHIWDSPPASLRQSLSRLYWEFIKIMVHVCLQRKTTLPGCKRNPCFCRYLVVRWRCQVCTYGTMQRSSQKSNFISWKVLFPALNCNIGLINTHIISLSISVVPKTKSQRSFWLCVCARVFVWSVKDKAIQVNH